MSNSSARKVQPKSLGMATDELERMADRTLYDSQMDTNEGRDPTETSSSADRHAALPTEEDILANLPMVRYLARRIHERLPSQVDLDDLVSAGLLGLLDAYRKFDSSKRVHFRSYAQFRVRGAMLDSLRSLDWGPRELRRRGRALEEATRSLTGSLKRVPNDAEIAGVMGISLQAYFHLVGELKRLDLSPMYRQKKEAPEEEEIVCQTASTDEDPLSLCLRLENVMHLGERVQKLPEKERLVITLYYYEELTMKEIGNTLNVVESRVSQIHSSALRRLRGAMSPATQERQKRSH